MAMQIESGSGTGNRAKVDADNRLVTFSVAEDHDREINRVKHKVWSLPFLAIDPVGANDYFVYIENTGSIVLEVTDIRVESTVAGRMYINHVSGTPTFTAGADISPVNRWLGSTNNPDAIIKTDTDTTGLTNEGTLFYVPLDTVDQENHLHTSAGMFIPPGQKIGLLWDTATGILTGTISLVEVATS